MSKIPFFVYAHPTLGRLVSLAFVWSCLYVSAVAQQFAGTNNTTANISRLGNVAIGYTPTTFTYAFDVNKAIANNYAVRFWNPDATGRGLWVQAGLNTASPVELLRLSTRTSTNADVQVFTVNTQGNINSAGSLTLGGDVSALGRQANFGNMIITGNNNPNRYMLELNVGNYEEGFLKINNGYTDLFTVRNPGVSINHNTPLGALDISLEETGLQKRILFKTANGAPAMFMYKKDLSNNSFYNWRMELGDSPVNGEQGVLKFVRNAPAAAGSETEAAGNVKMSLYGSGLVHISNKLMIGDLAVDYVDYYGGDYRLYVANGIRAEKVRVDLKSNWGDYVFEPTYKLRPLSELEAYIKQHKHLPDVPAAQQIEKEGIDVAEMQKIQMVKIEELTLYMLELKRENEALKQEVIQLKKYKSRK